MNRVVADSNVYVSAIVFGGKPMMLLDMESSATSFIARRISLRADRLHVATIAKSVTPTESLNVVPLDPDDDRVLECAVAAGATNIVTGDKHLLGLAASGASGFRDRQNS